MRLVRHWWESFISRVKKSALDSGSEGLGPNFYHYEDNWEYAQWLREYPESEFDVIVTSHQLGLGNEILGASLEEYSLLEPWEVLTEEE